MKLKINGILLFVSILIANTSYSQEVFNITIDRQYSTGQCNSGYLFINDTAIGYTLERPSLNNEANISSIPVGTYNGILRYDKNDKWRIQVEGVPGRSGIQIHIGNYVDQTKGCILIGKEISNNLCVLSKSTKAYTELKEFFYGSSYPINTPNKTIRVQITD